jgi:hypothetical protein
LPRSNQKLSGSGIHLLALGSREPWTLELLAFECLLIARRARILRIVLPWTSACRRPAGDG